MVSLKKNPYKSTKIRIFEKIHTKTDFFIRTCTDKSIRVGTLVSSRADTWRLCWVPRLHVIVTLSKLESSSLIVTRRVKCASLCQVIPVVTNDLGRSAKTSEKCWTILKKLKNFCRKFQRNFQFFTPIFQPRIFSSASPIFTTIFQPEFLTSIF